MDVKTKKLDLIEWLVNLTDENIIERVYDFKNTTTQDWYDELPESAKKSIARGLQEAKEGKVTPHDQVMERIREKYNIKK